MAVTERTVLEDRAAPTEPVIPLDPPAPSPITESRPARRRTARIPRRLAAAGILVAAISISPVLYLLIRDGFSISRILAELDNPSTARLVTNTIQLVAGVGIVTSVLGVGTAMLVARTDLPFRRLWTVLFTLPLGVPTFVSAYTWVALSFRHAPRSTLIYGLKGPVIILSLGLFPYVYLPVLAALRGLDPSQEEIARSLGQGRFSTFLRITLPQLRPAIAGGMLIVALHILAEFGALQLLRYQTFTTAIVRRATELGSPQAARSLSVVLATGALLLLLLDRIVRGRPSPTRTGGGSARPAELWKLGRSRMLWFGGAATLSLLSLGVPLYVAVQGMSSRLGSNANPIDWTRLGAAAGQTAKLAIVAALLATIAALPVSILAVRHPGRLSTAVERTTWVAHALPGVVIALSLIFIGARWLGPLYQSTTLLVLAYVVLYLPLAVGSQQVGIAHADRRYEEQARSLGRGPLTTFARITLPLASPAIAVGALLVALDVSKELTTTLLLRPTGTHTLATGLWGTTNGEVLDFAAAAPYGTVLLLIGAVPATLLARHALRQNR